MKKILGFTGLIGSGKDTASKYVGEKFGVPFFQISDVLKEIMKTRGVDTSRESMVAYGTEFAKELGEDYLAKIILEKIDGERGVISGMRQVAQIEYLRKNSNFYFVVIGADAEIRLQRAKAQAKEAAEETLDSFVQKEIRENSGGNIQRVFECLKMADTSIINNSSLEDFYKKLDELVERIKF